MHLLFLPPVPSLQSRSALSEPSCSFISSSRSLLHRYRRIQPRFPFPFPITAALDPSAVAPRWATIWRSSETNSPSPSPAGLPGAQYPTRPPITLDDLLQVVQGVAPDAWVNDIIRALLGYVERENGRWDCSAVPKEWTDAYGNIPPSFIGDGGEREVDQEIKMAVRKLNKEISRERKQDLKKKLGPLGFGGWKVSELTPNRTRRAVAVNWILYYMAMHYGD